MPTVVNSQEDYNNSRNRSYSSHGGLTIEQEVGLRFMEALVRRHSGEADAHGLAQRAREYTNAFCVEFNINY